VTNLPQHIIFFKKYCVADKAHNTIFFEKIMCCGRKNKVADTCHHKRQQHTDTYAHSHLKTQEATNSKITTAMQTHKEIINAVNTIKFNKILSSSQS